MLEEATTVYQKKSCSHCHSIQRQGFLDYMYMKHLRRGRAHLPMSSSPKSRTYWIQVVAGLVTMGWVTQLPQGSSYPRNLHQTCLEWRKIYYSKHKKASIVSFKGSLQEKNVIQQKKIMERIYSLVLLSRYNGELEVDRPRIDRAGGGRTGQVRPASQRTREIHAGERQTSFVHGVMDPDPGFGSNLDPIFQVRFIRRIVSGFGFCFKQFTLKAFVSINWQYFK